MSTILNRPNDGLGAKEKMRSRGCILSLLRVDGAH